MPSYQIAPIPDIELKAKDAKKIVEDLSARKSEEKLRRGTIPETFTALGEDVFCFDFGLEMEDKYQSLEGPKEYVKLVTIPVAFLSNKFIAVGNCKKDIRREIFNSVQNGFSIEYSLETIRFKEDIFRKVVEEAPSLLKATFEPKQKWERPEEVSGRDRELRLTEFWQEYEDEPISKIKVELPEVGENVTAGFNKYGVVVIYMRTLSIAQQVAILKSITDNIISKILERQTFQKRFLGG